MWSESLAFQAICSFFVTIAMIFCSAPLARFVGLVDTPSSRKQHIGETPLVGGLAIFVSLSAVTVFWGGTSHSPVTVNGNNADWVFMGCGAFLVATGILDDRFNLGVFIRVLSEVLVAVAVIELLDLRVAYLGDLLNTGFIRMDPVLAYPFTIVAIFGIINAFNMLDGMDGLLAALVITTLILFHFFTSTQPGFISLAVGASLLAFLASNLQLSPLIPKTFLGDAGSKLLGFIVVCLLLAAASGQVANTKLIKPATALFVVALPLFDMAFTSLRRVIRKGSPFAADRSHIHHLMQDLGFSDRRALVIILCIHSSVALIGLVLHRAGTPEYYQFAIFLGCFALYSLLSSQLWHVAARLQNQAVAINVQFETSTPASVGEAQSPPDNVSPLRPSAEKPFQEKP